jgi:hypothetical protein
MEHGWAEQEMAGAQVADLRRNKSLGKICQRLAAQAGKSFSAACGPASRQAAQRIFSLEQVGPTQLLHGHFAATAARCQAYPRVLVPQDTVEFNYRTHPATTGLGPTNSEPTGWGLFGHSALALSPAGEPLGLLHISFWVRDVAQLGQKHRRHQRTTAEKESAKWQTAKWQTALEAVAAQLPAGPEVVLIQDREGDLFAFLAGPRGPRTHLVVRAYEPRRVRLPERATSEPDASKPGATLLEVASEAPEVGQLTVYVPAKAGRPAREAVLSLRVQRLWVQRPHQVAKEVPTPEQELTVLCATETAPPAGVPPLHWVLLTTLPVPDAAAAREVVGYYTLRWRIERLHYVLKSGCRVERLQFDDVHTLQNALAVCAVVAWRLLQVTYHARLEPDAPATEVLTSAECTVLEAAQGRPVRTVHEALRAVARLGGWEEYPAAGEPGVKSLWTGFRDLEMLVRGWLLAHQANQHHL